MQMYDLFRDMNDGSKPTFMMRAPLSTISEFLNLRGEAEERIKREAPSVCCLYNSQRYGKVIHQVTLPVGER